MMFAVEFQRFDGEWIKVYNATTKKTVTFKTEEAATKQMKDWYPTFKQCRVVELKDE